MSAEGLPPVFKPLKPFLQRAEELDRDTTSDSCKIVAFHCRQYAMEKGLELRPTDTSGSGNGFLVSLMNKLEADKGKLPSEHDKAMGQDVVTKFAIDVFEKADQEDRAGFADKNTARGFYAASIFFEILRQFGEYEATVDTRRKYAKWKSAEIVKAIREGRPVVPGGPDGLTPEELGAESGGAVSAPLAPGGESLSESQSVLPVAPVPPPSATAPASLPSVPTFPSGTGASTGGGSAGVSGGGGGPSSAPATAFNPGFVPAPTLPSVPVHFPSAEATNFVPRAQHYPPGALTNDTQKMDDAVEYAKYAIRFLETNRDCDGALQCLEKAIAQLRASNGQQR